MKRKPKTKLGTENFSVELEKHGGDTSGSQEAGSWGSSHLRRLRVVDVSTKRAVWPGMERKPTKPSEADEPVASPAALEAAEPAALVAEPAAEDAEPAILLAALEADSPTLEADSEASEATLEAEEAAPPPTPKMVVAAEVVMVESPLVMVVAKEEVVMAEEDSAVAEPVSEPEAEPVAEEAPDCGHVRLETGKLEEWEELTTTVVGMLTPAAVCEDTVGQFRVEIPRLRRAI